MTSSPNGLVSAASEHFARLLSDEVGNEQTVTINPYTSIGFIIWYCFLCVCCGMPMFCFVIWCRRQFARDNDLPQLQEMERNIQEFARQEEARKKAALTKALEKGRMILTEAHLSPGRSGLTAVTDCSICLIQYQPGDKIVRSPNPRCGHIFHEDCIVAWLSTRPTPLCPCCRQHYILGDTAMPNASVHTITQRGESDQAAGFGAVVENDDDDDGADIEMGSINTGQENAELTTDSATDTSQSDHVCAETLAAEIETMSDSETEAPEKTDKAETAGKTKHESAEINIPPASLSRKDMLQDVHDRENSSSLVCTSCSD